jgi:hypothetical protein
MYLDSGGTRFESKLRYPKSLLSYIVVLLREMTRYCIETANFSFQIHII